MRVIINKTENTYTFIPTDQEEEEILTSIANIASKGDKLRYGGAGHYSDPADIEFLTVKLNLGGIPTEMTQGNIHWTEAVGGINLELKGATENDKYAINGISNMCYTGTSGIIYLERTIIDGKIALTFTGTYCKTCKSPIIGYGRASNWKVCAPCTSHCAHTFKRGAVRGGTTDIGVGNFCTQCGMVDKETSESLNQEPFHVHHERARKELGVDIIYRKP